MAFELVNLSCITNNAKSGVVPSIWEFYNKNGDTVTTAGYIPFETGIKNNDRVLVLASTASVQPAWYYATVSSGVVTLTACAGGSISSFADVTITSATDGDVLTYDGDDKVWKNAQPAA